MIDRELHEAAQQGEPVAEVVEHGNSYAKVKLLGDAFGTTKVGDKFYTAAPAAQPVQERVKELEEVAYALEAILQRMGDDATVGQVLALIDASKAALAQQGEQQPVGSVDYGCEPHRINWEINPFSLPDGTPLYAGAAPAAQPDHRAEFVRVIEFAIKQGIGAREFLDAWLHGDTSEWPEFTPAAPAKE